MFCMPPHIQYQYTYICNANATVAYPNEHIVQQHVYRRDDKLILHRFKGYSTFYIFLHLSTSHIFAKCQMFTIFSTFGTMKHETFIWNRNRFVLSEARECHCFRITFIRIYCIAMLRTKDSVHCHRSVAH